MKKEARENKQNSTCKSKCNRIRGKIINNNCRWEVNAHICIPTYVHMYEAIYKYSKCLDSAVE